MKVVLLLLYCLEYRADTKKITGTEISVTPKPKSFRKVPAKQIIVNPIMVRPTVRSHRIHVFHAPQPFRQLDLNMNPAAFPSPQFGPQSPVQDRSLEQLMVNDPQGIDG